MGDFTSNLENWMGLLPHKIRNVPLIYLAIPGTHNSMTYGINSNSSLAPDAENFVRDAYKFVPCIVRRWSITQNFDTIEQLKHGIRFFDLRLSTKRFEDGEIKIFYTHALYSFEITESLKQIHDFLVTHPKEFVILDFQHFYEFSENDHINLHQKIMDIFSGKLYKPSDGSLSDCNLNKSEKLGKQILIIYRGNVVPFYFWSGYYWPTPWPNTDNIGTLRMYLDRTLQQRSPGFGHVSQCIITPSSKFIALRTYSSLKAVAKKVLNDLSDWIAEQKPGPFSSHDRRTSNVFIADFIDIKDSDFCKIVVKLNEHLIYNEIEIRDI